MNRAGLADLLRSRRSRLAPADVGLPSGIRRRTPGLRRAEVASLAAISTDYYARLEQQRGPHPSPAVLAALARALRMSDDERDHLFHLAGLTPPWRNVVSPRVAPGMLHVLDRLTDTPAHVVSDIGDVLVQNALSIALSGHRAGHAGRERNVPWLWFTAAEARSRYPVEDWETHSRAHVAQLRAAYGRRGSDPDVLALVSDLLAASTEFTERWARHEAAVGADTKRIIHPEIGLLDLTSETLVNAASGQVLVVLLPRPGTDAREKLDLLRVIGTPNLTASSF